MMKETVDEGNWGGRREEMAGRRGGRRMGIWQKGKD